MPKKLTIDEIGKLAADPLFADLPDALKDPSCYADIERALANAVHSDHQHKTLKGYTRCKRCQAKLEKQRGLKKEIGFTSQEQYLGWKRIMSIIISQSDIHLS